MKWTERPVRARSVRAYSSRNATEMNWTELAALQFSSVQFVRSAQSVQRNWTGITVQLIVHSSDATELNWEFSSVQFRRYVRALCISCRSFVHVFVPCRLFAYTLIVNPLLMSLVAMVTVLDVTHRRWQNIWSNNRRKQILAQNGIWR